MATLKTGQTTDSSQTLTALDKDDFYSPDSKDTDNAEQKETSWTPEWTKWHGYYRTIPELREMINKFSSWTFGRGIKADKINKAKLKKIKGNGKESARLILKNQWRTAMICGDSFAEIVGDSAKRTTNLKPLNPGTITVFFNEFGIITRYEQYQDGEVINSWKPEEIYHLTFERIADENHGIPFPEAIVDLVNASVEALQDSRVLYHRSVKPIQFFEVATNDTAKLDSLETIINNAYKKSENVIISEGVLKEIKNTAIPQYGTLDSLNYLKFLIRKIVTACGMPEVVMGWGEETTEASANVIYLAFQQVIEDMQLYNQEMVELQLNIIIDLEFPASLEDKIKQNESKRGKGTTTDPNKDG